MSTLVPERVEQASGPELPDRLWHLAANAEQAALAEAGQPWRTACGQRRGPATGRSTWAGVPGGRRCVVCEDLMFGGV